ncbi:MAG TPA: HAD-IC family P-type ATPase [Hyphomicrobium sp.]|jgi:Ca2+-transporting ATPase
MSFSVVHGRLPGRMRIEIRQLFRNPELAAQLESSLRAMGQVATAQASSLTGRVLITFDARIAHTDIVDRIATAWDARAPDRAAAVADKKVSAPRTTMNGAQSVHAAAPAAPRKQKRSGRPSAKAARRIGEEALESPAWHAMSVEAVVASLASDVKQGLSSSEARRRLDEHGPNKGFERPPTSTLALVGRQFTSLPVGLLLGASVVSLLTGGAIDAVVTLAVVGINAAIGYGTESGSERIIRGMTRRQALAVPVLRDGAELFVDQEDIVPGDVLILRPATVVAADARLIESDGLFTNEALLTGESEPAEKGPTRPCLASEVLSQRRNMVYQGSFVVSGSACAVVTATGFGTETGRIETAARDVSTPRTPLERDLDDLGGQLAVLSLVACGAFFAAGYLRGRTWLSMMKSALALAVAAVPEGLPATATTTLALGLRELRRKGVIVRRLEAVEGLGSLQVICFDKTGTLTENRMQLDRLHLPGPDGGVALSWPREIDGAHSSLRRLFEIAALCSEVKLSDNGQGVELTGSATETALVEGAIAFGVSPASLHGEWPRTRLQYRSEQKRFMASYHKDRANGSGLVAIKGDPYQVLARCRRVMAADGTLSALTRGLRRELAGYSNDLAGRGLRVLGFAYAEGAPTSLTDERLVWVGAAGLKDPIVNGAKHLVERLHRAGVRPVMITGDQAATAEAVAKEIGLSGSESLHVLDSTALDKLSPELLSAIARRAHVFARVPPTKKLLIVRALQSERLTVGMIGDGFNDAPALKAADIAIAVGTESATAARDVADVIIAEKGLAVVADGIEQGRTILSNIRKSVHYLMSTNLSEILVLLAEALRQNDVLESPMELLWINLVTDVLPSLGLALEPSERFVMSVPPRSADEPLLTARDLRHSATEAAVIAAAALGAHGYGLARYGAGPQTRTVTFLSLVATQLLHALACRHDRFQPLGGRSLFGNAPLNAAILGSAGLQALPFLVPPLRRLLGISPPQPMDLGVAALAGLAAFAANESLLAYRTSGRINISPIRPAGIEITSASKQPRPFAPDTGRPHA